MRLPPEGAPFDALTDRLALCFSISGQRWSRICRDRTMPRVKRSAVARLIFAAWMSVVAAVTSAAASNAAADVDQGYTDLKHQRYQEAVEKFTRAIESGALSSEELSRAYDGRATAYNAQDQHEQAIADYESAIRLNANSAGSFTGRGIAYSSLGRYERPGGFRRRRQARSDCGDSLPEPRRRLRRTQALRRKPS